MEEENDDDAVALGGEASSQVCGCTMSPVSRTAYIITSADSVPQQAVHVPPTDIGSAASVSNDLSHGVCRARRWVVTRCYPIVLLSVMLGEGGTHDD